MVYGIYLTDAATVVYVNRKQLQRYEMWSKQNFFADVEATYFSHLYAQNLKYSTIPLYI